MEEGKREVVKMSIPVTIWLPTSSVNDLTETEHRCFNLNNSKHQSRHRTSQKNYVLIHHGVLQLHDTGQNSSCRLLDINMCIPYPVEPTKPGRLAVMPTGWPSKLADKMNPTSSNRLTWMPSFLVEERGTLAVGGVEWEGFPTNHNSPFLPPPLSPTHHTLCPHIRWYKHKRFWIAPGLAQQTPSYASAFSPHPLVGGLPVSVTPKSHSKWSVFHLAPGSFLGATGFNFGTLVVSNLH